MKDFEAVYWRIIVRSFKLFALLCLGLSAQGDIRLSPTESYTQEQAHDFCREQGKEWRTMQIQELFTLPPSTPFTAGFSYWSGTNIASGDAVIGTGSEGDGGVIARIGFAFYAKERNVTPSPPNKKVAAICTDQPEKKVLHTYQKTEQGIADKESGILWHDLDATDKRVKYTFSEAEAMCENLTLHGRSWRLPTSDELYGIVDYTYVRPTLDMKFFGPVMHRYYWTGDSFNDKEAYVVGFKLGSVATAPKKESAHARCVSDSE